MTNKERTLILMAKADEIAAEFPGAFDGLVILGSWVDPHDGATCLGSSVRGNRHAVQGAMDEYLAKSRDYDTGYNAEEGRYDSVVHRQKKNPHQ